MIDQTLKPMAEHLLQSTLFAAAAALLVRWLKKNSAQTRHWIWLTASVKFLIPFSLLLSAGSHLSWLLPAEQTPRLTGFFEEFDQGPAAAAMRPAQHLILWPPVSGILAAIWFVGFAALVVFWIGRWRRVSADMREATPVNGGRVHEILKRVQSRMGVTSEIELVSTGSAYEPGVFGIRRSVLMLPARVSETLETAQLEAVLAHEIVHVRRRDNLMAAVHMLVEAVFWFHPLVWWLGAKLMTERERACDEEVLRLGSDSETYAEGILEVCRISLASPLACVSGVTGSDLKKRIEQIMTLRAGERLNRTKRSLLAGLGVVAIVAPVIVGLLSAPRGVAQSAMPTTGHPTFDVASIKPSAPDARGIRVNFAPGGRFIGSNLTLRFLIKIAYDLRDDQIAGGPNWLGSKRFEVEAKCDPPIHGNPRDMTEQERKAFNDQLRLRLQSLLADRFQLKLRQETKELPIYALVVAKNGPKLKESDEPNSVPRQIKLTPGMVDTPHTDMASFAQVLSEATGRTVNDQTGLKGIYNVHLEWAPDPLPGGPNPGTSADARPPDSSGPSLFTSLQEQLGLKLVSTKGPAPFATVTAAELPTGN